MKTEADMAHPPPTEVLIPEARRHRRRRHLRIGVVLGLVAVLLAALIVAAVAAWGSHTDGTSHSSPERVAARHHLAPVYVRPILCEAPPYEPAERGQSAQVSPSCSAASALDGSESQYSALQYFLVRVHNESEPDTS